MKIMIVDDDIAIIESIRDMVRWEKLGISEVQTAVSAEQAKNLLLASPADIVISDIEMPGESGLELLKWYRDKQLSGKFLLLTCHESFQYATEALKLHAEEYLLKPFNVEMMEMVLQKIVFSIREEQEKEKSPGMDAWTENQERKNKWTFWAELLYGRIDNTRGDLKRELEMRNLNLDLEMPRRLVVSRITNLEKDMETLGAPLVQFILENLQSELLSGSPENERIVFFRHHDHYVFAAVCDEEDEGRLLKTCENLIQKCENLLSLTITCCISESCRCEEIYETFQRMEYKLQQNIIYYGAAFLEREALEGTADRKPLLDLKKMETFLRERNKKGFLDYLKKELNLAAQLKILNGEQLKGVQREVQQAVYAYLASHGIMITLLLGDETSVQISERADQSVIDMIRWVNYLIPRVFEYEDEVRQSSGIIEKINQYIQEHYRENIGRNEIGDAFYLVPEYLAKMYKKKTGKALKDAINEYRLEKAREILLYTDQKVSDVAMEVGFDNFSYFSTLFKKNMGITPNEYRRNMNQTKG